MGNRTTRIFRSARAVAKPPTIAARNAAKAEKELAGRVTDEQVASENATLRDNLRAMHIQSNSQVTKAEHPYGSAIKQHRSMVGMTSDEVLEMFYHQHMNSGEVGTRWSAEQVATKYQLSRSDLDNLLKYFNNLKIVATIPQAELKDNPD